MGKINLTKIEKTMKSYFKKKMSISQKTLITFLITGMFGIGIQINAGVLNDDAKNSIHIGTVNNEGNNNILVGNVATNGQYSLIFAEKPNVGWHGRGKYKIAFGSDVAADSNVNYGIIFGDSAFHGGTGSYKFIFGEAAGFKNNDNYNFAFGKEAGRKVAGDYNFAFGFQAGQDIGKWTNGNNVEVGGNNIFLMQGAGNQTKGSFNTAIGFQAGEGTKGHYNFAVGSQAGKVVVGDDNIAMGSHAGKNVTGRVNYALGINAGQNVTGNGNYAIGENAGQYVKGATNPASETKGWSNVAIGKSAGNHVIGNHNYSFGENAGKYVGYTVTWNEGVFSNSTNPQEYIRPGENGSSKQTGAEHNIALGANSGSYIAGQDNVALGQGAGSYIDGANSGGAANTAIGKGAGNKVYGDENISMGSTAGNDINGHKNIALGVSSASKIKGNNNIAIGVSSSNTTASFVEKENSISIGTTADATKNNAIAIGKGAKADGKDSISIGTGNVVSGNKSGAIGDPSYVSGEGTYTLGNDNGTETENIAANNAGIFGNSNKMTTDAEGSRIIGNSNNATASNVFILGNSVTANVGNSVYLGLESAALAADGNTTAGKTEYNSVTINAVENGRVARNIELSGFAGHTPVGVVTVGASGAERRIQNVAAGKISETSTDAVNGSQLYALASKMTDIAGVAAANTIKYFSVNSNADGNKDNSGATGLNAIAIGPNSKAENKNSLAIGDKANAGEYAVALGTETTADGKGAVALGNRIVASGENSTAIGVQVTATGLQAISIGGLSKAEGNHSIAIGSSSHASKLSSIAIGTSSVANKLNSIAIGNNSKSLNNNSIVLGNSSTAFGANNITIGKLSFTNNIDSTAVGNEIFTIGSYSTALGSHSSALSDSAIGIGNGASAAANKSVSIGYNSSAEGMYSISFGSDSTAKSDNSVAIGNFAKSNKISGVALGANSVVNSDIGILGYDHFSRKIISTSDIQGLSEEAKQKIPQLETTVLKLKSDYESKVNTYLERLNTLNSELREAVLKKNEDKIGELTDEKENLELELDEARENYLSNDSVIEYNKLVGAWKSSLGAVSVGDSEKGLTRQITNLAAGTEATDAVNLAQLKGVTLRVTGDNLKTATDAIGKVKLSEQNLAINGTEGEITTSVTKDGQAVTISLANEIKTSIASIANKADKSEIKTYVVEAGKNVVVTPDTTTAGTVKFTVDAEKTVIVAGTGLKLESTTAATKENNYTNTYTLALDDELTTKINSTSPDTYFHVNTGSNAGGNATTNLGKVNEAAGATALNSLAAGIESTAKAQNSLAIGRRAITDSKSGIAIGDFARAQGSGRSGIAIGENAESIYIGTGNHEALVKFGREETQLGGGIAIGRDTYSRLGNVELGHRDYRGIIGDFDFKKEGGKLNGNAIANNGSLVNSDVTTGIGTTAIGDNSFAMGNFQSITGSYNLISKTYDKPTAAWVGGMFERGANAVHNAGAAVQGFGSSIVGSLNSIEANEELSGPTNIFGAAPLLGGVLPVKGLMYSGMASNIVGTSNRVNKSNGALIFGIANEITNSYLTPKNQLKTDALSMNNVPVFGRIDVESSIKAKSIKELAEKLREYSQDNRLASVGIIGGANKADYALFSNINGVGNILIGKGASENLALTERNTTYSTTNSYDNFAAFNSINGYENKGTNVSHTVLTGAWNEISNGSKNIITGNNHIIKGTDADKAEGNIVLGFNTTKAETNFKASADNIVAIGNDIVATENNSVYLGNGSKNATTNVSKVMEEYNTDTINGITLNFAGGTPAGIVSVGSEGKERRIQNVAAGLISATSTDAINGSQLHSVINNMTTKIEALATPNVVVKGNGPITVTPVEENKEKVFKVGVTLGEITSVTGGKAETVNEAGLVTSGNVVNAVNALGNNTIKLSGNIGKTNAQNLNKENGLEFSIIGKGYVKTEANGNEISIDLTDDAKQKLDGIKASTTDVTAGVASAMAMANLPQVSNIAGHRHNIAASYGFYKGEQAFALGLSGLNERGNVVYKASGSLNTKGHVSFGAGIGYQFDKLFARSDDKLTLQKNGNINALDEKVHTLTLENEKLQKSNKELTEKLERLEKIVEKLVK